MSRLNRSVHCLAVVLWSLTLSGASDADERLLSNQGNLMEINNYCCITVPEFLLGPPCNLSAESEQAKACLAERVQVTRSAQAWCNDFCEANAPSCKRGACSVPWHRF